MSDELKGQKPAISLTLEGDEQAPIDPKTPAAVPTLSTKPLEQQVADVSQDVVAKPLDDSSLTPEEREQVEAFAGQIDISNANQVLQYGASAQRNIASFSESALEKVRTKDSGDVGDMLSTLVVQLQSFSLSEEEPKGLAKLFRKASNKVEMMRTQYDSVEKNVDKVAVTLQNEQIQLMKDVAMLDEMYERNLVYYKELTMYILAGKKALVKSRADLQTLMDHASQTGLPEDAQAANDFSSQINRFEKKLHDLELTRVVSIQMAPQVRLVQNNDIMMVEKIQTSLVNTIPLWKNQMVLALSIANNQKALKSQRAVTDMTNDLLRQNADTLKMGTIETAKESERAIVDIETLQHTNEQLITTLDEVVKIQAEGRQKRQQAETQMAQIEGDLKSKLLELKQNQEQLPPKQN